MYDILHTRAQTHMYQDEVHTCMNVNAVDYVCIYSKYVPAIFQGQERIVAAHLTLIRMSNVTHTAHCTIVYTSILYLSNHSVAEEIISGPTDCHMHE